MPNIAIDVDVVSTVSRHKRTFELRPMLSAKFPSANRTSPFRPQRSGFVPRTGNPVGSCNSGVFRMLIEPRTVLAKSYNDDIIHLINITGLSRGRAL